MSDKANQDLLKNFETWPESVQQSFLELLSRTAKELPESARLHNTINEFRIALRDHQHKIESFLKELKALPNLDKLLAQYAAQTDFRQFLTELQTQQKLYSSLCEYLSETQPHKASKNGG